VDISLCLRRVASETPDLRFTFPAYAGTHCSYPQRDGQAELIWVAGNMPRGSPIPALTGLDVEQLHRSRRARYRYTPNRRRLTNKAGVLNLRPGMFRNLCLALCLKSSSEVSRTQPKTTN